MTELMSFLAICLLVAFVLLRAYAARSLIHLRRRANEVLVDEHQTRLTREREAATLEGLEARVVQLQEDQVRRHDQVRELDDVLARTEAELARVKGEDGEQAARSASLRPES